MEYSKAKISLEELLYDILFSIVLFTKGIGLDEGSLLFRCCLLFAILLLACKFLMGKYCIAELIIVSLLGIWGIFTFKVTGSLGMLIYVILIIGMKNVSVKRVFTVGMWVWSLCMLYTVTAAVFFGRTGVRLIHEKLGLGPLLRESLGYTHPNVLHITYIVLMAFALYLCRESQKKFFTAAFLLLLGDVYIFLYSVSFTGLLFSFTLLFLFFYFQRRKAFSKLEMVMIEGMPILCIIISIVLPLILDDGILYKVLNKILNNRVWAIRTFFQYYQVTFFGGGNEGIDFSLDNSYVSALNGYGMIPLAIIILTYCLLLRYYLKKNRRMELAIICTFLIAGLSEPFLFNASVKNITVVSIGEFLYETIRERGVVFQLFSAHNRSFLLPIGFWERIRKWLSRVKWKIAVGVILLTGMGCFLCLLPRDCIGIDQVYADESLCHVGGETVLLPEEPTDERTLYIGNTSADINYYFFSRENSNLIEIMDLRVKVSVSFYVAAFVGMLFVCVNGRFGRKDG